MSKLTSLHSKKTEIIEEKEEETLGDELLLVDDEPIEKPAKAQPQPKPKPERTAKQIETFEKAKLKRLANIEIQKQIKAQEEQKKKKEQEDLIVKKAIAIKKREMKKKAILEEIEDDDTPIEKIREIVKQDKISKAVATPPPPPPPPLTFAQKYRFVKI